MGKAIKCQIHDARCQIFQNVEKYFAVVGVLEDFDMSLEVLESYLPRFFAGVREEVKRNSTIR